MKTEIDIKKMKFGEYYELVKNKEEGIVFLGCSNYQGYIDGIVSDLKENIVITDDVNDPWKEIILLETTGGRQDLVFIMDKDIKFDMGRFAITRFQLPKNNWISDHIVNYRNDYGY